MKKICVFVLFLILCGCVEAGKFSDKRERLHNMGAENQAEFCKQNPDRCYNGIPW